MAIHRTQLDDHNNRRQSYHGHNDNATTDLTGPASSSTFAANVVEHHCQSSSPICLPCGACRCCEDGCGEPTCEDCFHNENVNNDSQQKDERWCFERRRLEVGGGARQQQGHPSSCTSSNRRKSTYTMCEIRRHNTTESAWLVAGNDIYDVTEYMTVHPGGSSSLLKKSGGVVDCTRDLNFHSRKGQKLWQKYHVGKVGECPGTRRAQQSKQKVVSAVEKDWWKFWE
mmetsp:Transcript_10782/g.25694  ORF Transcript_10782/g.25694 Transcript_10782/m.25694 type:complete len:227 (+) Transcript_10782:273-953(+)|eukprot:CAMPEP_0113514896 /NCGR_PEP_ID=MMETSP0014_2-20120614/40653_1 /TAXON_ID=2857 /ORGANISM="Nitzschia sp." /LENGTH=226 /DNA_ID=CAMNT_0000411423 /DNA_START=393 /DNA_END=1073 /DNA_ORIENTATION=- /assembly_acc=CAM_ASM_000159